MENHKITIESRQKIVISQVADVDAFDESALWANLKEGSIELTGENLNIEQLDLGSGILTVTGKIDSVVYSDKNKIKKHWISKLFAKRRDQ